MAARKPGRYLAPLALVATVVAIFLLVQRNETTSNHAPASRVIPRTLAHSPSRGNSPARHRRVFYIVQPGDTLSGISATTGVPEATLQSLNPSINPSALQTGERLRLRK
jgi:hypothetical protein